MLAWDARYADVVGAEWRPAALDAAVTIADLLGHTSGFGDYFDEEDPSAEYADIWRRIPPGTMRGPKDFWPLLRDLPQKSAPGARAVYNNGAYILVGIAIEERTGRSFPDIVRDEVSGPLAMTRSGFWALDDVVADLATGYLPPVDGGTWRTNVHAVPVLGGPDGGVQVTVDDLVRLVDGVAGRGRADSFLTPDTRAELIGPHATSDDGIFRFGRGVLHVGEGASTRFGHTGEDPGASARVWTYPGTGERVAVVSNVTEGAGPITRRIDDLLVSGASRSSLPRVEARRDP